MPAANIGNNLRVYVSVDVAFDNSGRMMPMVLTWEDGHRYEIDQVLDVRPSYSEKAGGQGDRYTVRIQNKERHLFFEHNPVFGQAITGRWFVERK